SPWFGDLVSTGRTRPCVTHTVVFPPAPGITYRLSRTFLIVPVGGIRGRCCCAAAPATARPTTTIAERSLLRAIRRGTYERPRGPPGTNGRALYDRANADGRRTRTPRTNTRNPRTQQLREAFPWDA